MNALDQKRPLETRHLTATQPIPLPPSTVRRWWWVTAPFLAGAAIGHHLAHILIGH